MNIYVRNFTVVGCNLRNFVFVNIFLKQRRLNYFQTLPNNSEFYCIYRLIEIIIIYLCEDTALPDAEFLNPLKNCRRATQSILVFLPRTVRRRDEASRARRYLQFKWCLFFRNRSDGLRLAEQIAGAQLQECLQNIELNGSLHKRYNTSCLRLASATTSSRLRR